MQVWIDNTGLHSAGRCLHREATIDEDIDGLLQFATLLVFARKITFGDYRSERVAEETARFLGTLSSQGVSSRVLVAKRLDSAGYEKACRATAAAAAEAWPAQLDEEISGPQAASFDAPNQADRPLGWVMALAAGKPIPALPGVGDRSRLRQKGRDAVEYMLAVSPQLRESLSRTQAARGWGPAETYHLESFLRASLNDRLAEDRKANYVPAVSRAAELASQNNRLIEQLRKELGDMAARLKPEAPPAPSVYRALLERGRGDPGGIVQEALEMRARAGWLRKYLEERIARLNADPDSAGSEAAEDDEFSRYARWKLKLEKEPRLADAIEFQISLGLLPSLNFALKASPAMDWARHGWWERRRLSVLTDIVKSSAPAARTANWQALKRLAMKPGGAR